MVPPSHPPGEQPPGAPTDEVRPHFRAHPRRAVRLRVGLIGHRSGIERQATVVDVSLAGAGIETDEPLAPGEQVSLSFAPPTLWDPLVLSAVVAWAHPMRATEDRDALGRPRLSSRSGVSFAYPTAEAVLAMFEMLATLGYE